MSDHTVVIVGSGPGGLQLAYFLSKAGVDYVILEKNSRAGSFYAKYPRRRDLISFNRVNTLFDDPRINLRFDWNSLLTDDYSFPFSAYSKKLYPKADDLVRYLNDFADKYSLNISYGIEVLGICKSDHGGYELSVSTGQILKCSKLVIASGFSKAYSPDIPGLELCDTYADVSTDPDSFDNKRVLVIGKGNSAFEIADLALESCSLLHIASPNPITLAWKSRHPGHVRANHTRLLDSYQLKLLNGTLDCNILSVRKNNDGAYIVLVSYVHADGETEELVYDQVINCAGFSFDDSLFADNCKPSTILDGKLPEITPFWESVNQSGMYFAGTLMQGRDFKRSSSAFIGGFRYNVRTLSKKIISDFKSHPYPSTLIPIESASAFSSRILERCNTTSGLWAQFKYLCDVYIVNQHSIKWIQEYPYQFIQEGGFSELPHYFTLTFEWGDWPGDVMSIERHPSADKAYTNVFLHPILRQYAGSEIISTHHILEDLFGNYSNEAEMGNVLSRGGLKMQEYHHKQHYLPLVEYISSTLFQNDLVVLRPAESFMEVPKAASAWDG